MRQERRAAVWSGAKGEVLWWKLGGGEADEGCAHTPWSVRVTRSYLVGLDGGGALNRPTLTTSADHMGSREDEGRAESLRRARI